MSKKVNWAEMDKRILNRKAVWSPEERTALEDSLKKLADSAERSEAVELEQPAVGGADDEEDAN